MVLAVFSVHFWASKSEPRGTGARSPRDARGCGGGQPPQDLNRGGRGRAAPDTPGAWGRVAPTGSEPRGVEAGPRDQRKGAALWSQQLPARSPCTPAKKKWIILAAAAAAPGPVCPVVHPAAKLGGGGGPAGLHQSQCPVLGDNGGGGRDCLSRVGARDSRAGGRGHGGADVRPAGWPLPGHLGKPLEVWREIQRQFTEIVYLSGAMEETEAFFCG